MNLVGQNPDPDCFFEVRIVSVLFSYLQYIFAVICGTPSTKMLFTGREKYLYLYDRKT